MLRIDRNQKSLTPMTNQSLSEAGLKERYDLQQLIRQNAEAFFTEMGETLLLIGEEVRPTDVVDDRIDLLAVDKDAAAVVIEIKRGNDRLQLLQALSYTAMVSKWEPQQLIDSLSVLSGVPNEEAQEQIEEFFDADMSALNQWQRVVLLAEAFDFEVLATTEWLSEQYELDIRCYQLKLETDRTTYSFSAPNEGEVTIVINLIFRRAFIELIEQKGWDTPDILIARQKLYLH